MAMTTADYFALARKRTADMNELLGYLPCESEPERCAVCGAPLYVGTQRYLSDNGELLGCEACVCVEYC